MEDPGSNSCLQLIARRATENSPRLTASQPLAEMGCTEREEDSMIKK
jgi:hypothetical protein